MARNRPAMRYHGGKWKLAPWIISHFPPHRCYVEPFGGAASVLLRKDRCYAEVYNDLCGEVVNLFKVLRDDGNKFQEMLRLTPFARDEFIESYYPHDDEVEQARRTVVRSFMGFGSDAVSSARHTSKKFSKPSTGFRANSNRSGTTPAHDWANYPDALPFLIQRMRGVVIENREATEIMAQHDSTDTLFYLDPPYVFSTRAAGQAYRYEMDDNAHSVLADFAKNLKGRVCISGYDSPLYNSLYAGWNSVKKNALADGASKRVEVLWMNYDQPIRLI